MAHENDRVEAEPFADGLDIGDEGLAGVVPSGATRYRRGALGRVDKAVAVGGSLAELVEPVAGDAEAVEGEDDGSVIRSPLLVGELQVATGGSPLAVGRSQGSGLRGSLAARARPPRVLDDSTGRMWPEDEGSGARLDVALDDQRRASEAVTTR